MLNRSLSLVFALGLLAAAGCTEPEPYETTTYGNEIEEVGEYTSYGEPLATDETIVALTPAAVTQDIGTYQNTFVRVKGTVAQVCKMAGCWLTLQNPTAMPIRVVVPKDSTGSYLFTFPTGLGAQEVIVEGTVTADTMSVETLRHLAEDEGRSAAEVEAITEPERTIVLTARGALVKRAEPVAQS